MAGVVDSSCLKVQVTDAAAVTVSVVVKEQASFRSDPSSTKYSLFTWTSTAETWTVKEQMNHKMLLKSLLQTITLQRF